ncbi:radical SAM protein [Streptomyces sp. NPDC037389]|uniref:radical SAM protein n=1 Tax=Streptomyces sp. NPDC037389 TaxID=3155369 RepID=UPI00340184AB
MPRERAFEPVIDQHDTWIAINPVQGCPWGCRYCYLTDLGLTRTKPAVLATPEETLDQLLTSPYYHPGLVLALYTCTDALATPVTRAHLTALLDVLSASPIRNPVCLITKGRMTDDAVDAITRARRAGLPVIVYLSYSGLGPDIERGINHQALRENFPRLHAAGIPVIHYWRPALPHNSSVEACERVLDWASRYAVCTVAVGTKVKPTALEQITELWPELDDPHLDPQAADSVWPRATWDWLRHLPERYPGYPVFQTNSCALAHVLGLPDRDGVLNTPTCLSANHCPDRQRTLCRAAPARPPVTTTDIDGHLARLGHPGLPYTLAPGTRTVVLGQPLPLRDRHSLAQVLGVTVRSPQHPDERYWPGRLSGAQPLIIDPH